MYISNIALKSEFCSCKTTKIWTPMFTYINRNENPDLINQNKQFVSNKYKGGK